MHSVQALWLLPLQPRALASHVHVFRAALVRVERVPCVRDFLAAEAGDAETRHPCPVTCVGAMQPSRLVVGAAGYQSMVDVVEILVVGRVIHTPDSS
jgi:hypothetical protein